MKRILSLAAGFVFSLSLSQAAIVVNFVSQGAAGAGANGGTEYTYDIDISADTTARAGVDYFVIYDFGPVLSATFSSPAQWGLGAAQLLGPYPPAQGPNDSGSILNIQINKIGANLSGPAFNGASDLTIVLESASSILLNGTLNVSSQFLDNTGGTGSGGDTRDLPVPDSGVPEPGTMGLLGGSLLGLGALVRRRRNS